MMRWYSDAFSPSLHLTTSVDDLSTMHMRMYYVYTIQYLQEDKVGASGQINSLRAPLGSGEIV